MHLPTNNWGENEDENCLAFTKQQMAAINLGKTKQNISLHTKELL